MSLAPKEWMIFTPSTIFITTHDNGKITYDPPEETWWKKIQLEKEKEMSESKFTPEVLQDIFSYHAPSLDQQVQYQVIRDAALEFSKILVTNTPASADQTTAIRKLREVVMTANASIALEGKY